jgi:hypothetical protein
MKESEMEFDRDQTFAVLNIWMLKRRGAKRRSTGPSRRVGGSLRN